MITPSSGWERWRGMDGGDDDDDELMMMMEEKKMKPKWGFIFQINEHGFGTRLHEEKGQKKDLTTLTTHSSFSIPPSFPSKFLLISSWLLIVTLFNAST
jgi:hypothetical protein